MMETLAKQLQKASQRFNDEAEKNGKLKAMMLEMRSDMEAREKELENKIKLQQGAMKKSEVKMSKTETKLERTGNKYAGIKAELDEAIKQRQEYAERLQIMEEKYERALVETEERTEQEFRAMKEAFDKENAALQASVEEEITALTGKLLDMEKLFDEEAAEHDKTSAKVRELEEELNDKEDLIAELSEHKFNYADRAKREAQQEMDGVNEMAVTKEKLIALETDIKVLRDDKLKKKEMLKKYADEVEALHTKINNMNDGFIKEAKTKDLEFVKAKKKWSISEEKLREEIKELKQLNEKFEALLETASGNIIVETAIEDRKLIQSQKKLIEQLRADKATLQLNLATFEGKKNKEILNLKKQLDMAKMSSYERKLSVSHKLGDDNRDDEKNHVEEPEDEKIDNTNERQNNLATDNIESQPSEQESTGSTFLVNLSKKSLPVSVESSSQRKGMTTNHSYRNFVRNKKFSKKNIVGSE